MRRCTSCNTLYDNGVQYCERCGEKFPYDPKITPYSEGRIAIIMIILIAICLLAYNTYISQPIRSDACSRTNFLRVQKIIDDARNTVMRQQDHGFASIASGTIVMKQRYMMEEIYLPPCFEPIRQDMIDYVLLMHRVTRISAFGGQLYTSPLLEQAFLAQKRVDSTMETIRQCLPNCPDHILYPPKPDN